MTSNPDGDPHALVLQTAEFATGGLPVVSYARPGKLFTAHAGLLLRVVGQLTPSALDGLRTSVVRLLVG